MLEISSILLMSIVLLSLTVVLIVLFLKHINVMYVFIEEMRKVQTSIHSDIAEIKLNIARIISEGLKYDENKKENLVSASVEKKNNEIIKIPEVKLERLPDNKKSRKIVKENHYGDINSFKSSEVSERELLNLIGDKELMFKKEINLASGEMFVNADINIDMDKKK